MLLAQLQALLPLASPRSFCASLGIAVMPPCHQPQPLHWDPSLPHLSSPQEQGMLPTAHTLFSRFPLQEAPQSNSVVNPTSVGNARSPLQRPKVREWWQGLAGGSQTPSIHPAGAAPPSSLPSSPKMGDGGKKVLSPCPSSTSSLAQDQPSTEVTPDSPCWG